MQYNRPIVLSIAGFDPSGGAGVLADIKTMEQHHCLGMAVNTAYTNQSEDEFVSVKWRGMDKILQEIRTLMNKYTIDHVKIGMIRNLDTLHKVIAFLQIKNPDVKIVWDPVLSASAGPKLMSIGDQKKLEEILKQLFLITPNTNEAIKLSGIDKENEAGVYLSKFCNVLLKGGHSKDYKGVDRLITHGKITDIPGNAKAFHYQKHGSGCILSAAIASNIAHDHSLTDSCKKAKRYIEKVLNSNPNLLAYHAS